MSGALLVIVGAVKSALGKQRPRMGSPRSRGRHRASSIERASPARNRKRMRATDVGSKAGGCAAKSVPSGEIDLLGCSVPLGGQSEPCGLAMV